MWVVFGVLVLLRRSAHAGLPDWYWWVGAALLGLVGVLVVLVTSLRVRLMSQGTDRDELLESVVSLDDLLDADFERVHTECSAALRRANARCTEVKWLDGAPLICEVRGKSFALIPAVPLEPTPLGLGGPEGCVVAMFEGHRWQGRPMFFFGPPAQARKQLEAAVERTIGGLSVEPGT